MNSTVDGVRSGEYVSSKKIRFSRLAMLCPAMLAAALVLGPMSSQPARPPAGGEMVAVNGTNMHVLEQGAEHAGPTVVLETGFGGSSIGWAWVQPQVARFARVIAYDRAGLGWSEDNGIAHDADHIARQLHATLERMGAPKPYVMVGHSLGGAFVRRFTALYPRDVGAVVLVDSVHPEQAERLNAYVYNHPWRVVMVGRALARVGLVRLFGIPSEIDALPPAARASAQYLVRSPSHWAGMSSEALAFHKSLDQAKALESFGDRPLIVLSATTGRRPGWPELQHELAALSSRGELRAPAGTDHYGLVTNHAQATYTITAIRDAYSQAAQDSTGHREAMTAALRQ